MECRSVIPRTVRAELWTIARASAPLIDGQVEASERIDQFRADLSDALIKFKMDKELSVKNWSSTFVAD